MNDPQVGVQRSCDVVPDAGLVNFMRTCFVC
jgi:hypothetical protein